ncbi:MAG: CPBP family intramembrane glutamic endopeptidase [Cyanobacteriota bacterium]|nr:CPBP family intramembrane glutamic endopeptidase [Cyanobacteriota bacterium]
MTHEHKAKGHGQENSTLATVWDENPSHPLFAPRHLAAPAPPPPPLPSPPPRGASPGDGQQGWKALLALLALGLSGLIWIGGLRDSLNRPSVVDALDLRQMELSVLAAGALPPSLRPFLVGEDPRGALREALEKRLQDPSSPPPVAQRLELVLLQRGQGAPPETAAPSSLAELAPRVNQERRPLLLALERGATVPPERQQALLAPWGEGSLVAQLGCEQLAAGPSALCPTGRDGPWLALRLVGLTLVPALLLLTGAALLSRQVWLFWRGRLPEPPPLIGPPLSVADATLVIAGGFVLAGEVLLPSISQQTLGPWLAHGPLPPATRQGVEVMASYLGLMVAPLGLLALLLPRGLLPPQGGWLQWGWRPPWAATQPALRMVLMVLPLVALASWLLQLVWPDPGGSNPLLEMVLGSSDGWALAVLAFTAVVLAPLFEETLFRGVLLPVLARPLGGGWAVVISALLFALAHLSLGELVPLSVLGLGLGLLRWQTGRLASSVCLHALWNGLTFFNLLLLAN